MNDPLVYCNPKNCPLMNDCYRFSAEQYGRRDFFATTPFNTNTVSCDFFISNLQQIREEAYALSTQNPSKTALENWLQAKTNILERRLSM